MSEDNGKKSDVLVRVEGLKKYFPITRGIFQRHAGDVKAVDGIDLEIYRGETLGLVGESGCGKSTTGRTILQLYRPTAGKVYIEGVDLVDVKGGELRQMRRQMQMIFQDPYASLNPRMTVGGIIGEPLDIFGVAKGSAKKERVEELLQLVGMNPYFANRYRTSSPEGSGSALGWRGRWRCSPISSCVTSRSRRWTCRSRRRW